MTSLTRVAGAGLAAALVAGIGGRALETVRFGAADADAAARIHAELQQRFDHSAETLLSMAARAGGARSAIRAAPRDSAALNRLFDIAEGVLPNDDRARMGITVYDAAGAPIAWAGRVSDLPRPRVNGPPALFVAPGALGPRLVLVAPLVDPSLREGPRSATIVVEQVLADLGGPRGAGDTFIVATSLVPVTLRARIGGAGPPPTDPYRFTISAPAGGGLAAGAVLVDAELSPTGLAAARGRWTRGTWACVSAVLAVTLLLCASLVAERRRRSRTSAAHARATAGLVAAVIGARVLFSAATFLLVGPHPSTDPAELAATGLALVVVVWLSLDLIEQRRLVRPRAHLLSPGAPGSALLAAAYLAAGAIDAGILLQYQRALRSIVANTPIDLVHFAHSPLTLGRLALAFGLVLLHAGVIWMAVAILRAPRLFWRTPRRIMAWAAVCGWGLGVFATVAWAVGLSDVEVPVVPLLVGLAAAAGCAVGLGSANRKTRRSSQAMRLATIFLALLVPALAMYPSVFALTAEAKEQLVATSYRPEVQSQRRDLQDRMRRTLDQIDALPVLSSFLVPSADDTVTTSDRAYRLWSQTDLAAYRLTSSVELYAADGRIASLFALNLPETTGTMYRATGCDWNVFDEESPFGANGRHLLRASRGICDRGRIAGAIVVRSMLDYRTLPFGGSQSPYLASMLLDPAGVVEDRTENDVEFVLYGWSRAPIYTSGTSVWTLPDAAFERMTESREPLWTSIDRDNQSFRVYLFNDRGGVYALGYPVITWFGHLINLVELGTLTMVLYVMLLGAGTLLNALTSRSPTSGRALLREVRSSFYRKLFLYFVAGAVVPVMTLALATRTYFATQLRAGIDAAAAKTATVAQRLVDDYATLQQPGPGALDVIDNQVMLLVGQAIDQDVNLFNRVRLQATSEPDLFESQVLSTRTPAEVYRRILLDRLPTFVGEQAVGEFHYRIAAAPVRAGAREGIVTVPLALRDQEIEQQIDQLDHRVLFGAVLFSLLGAGLGYWMAERIADPVNRLTRATRRIARGDLDARIAATSSDELRRLVEDFNQMAADLKRQRSELERTQRLDAWADMARQVAHDIKNPLTPIQLSAEHARRINIDNGRPLSPVLDECVAAILSQVKLLRRISAEFSSFGSSPTPQFAPTDLGALIEEVVGPYRTGLADRIAIETVAAPDLPTVNLDRALFARALTNVIENALHAMPGTGRLMLSTRQSADPGGTGQPPSVAVVPGARSVVVEVSDTGVGMDQPALDRIFEPYFSTKTTGTGLGLTIAKRNVELNGGAIKVTSERGVGTTVRLTLPA